MKTNDFSYFIERYNAGEMSDSEKLWFGKELDGNEKLQKEVILRKRADEILNDKDIISLRNKLSGIEKMRSENIPARKSKKPLYVGSFSVLAVLVLTGALTVFPGRHQNNEEILNRYYKEYVPTSEQRSLATLKNDNFNQAMEFFESHDYRNAAFYFSKVVESTPKNMSANLLNGISNFEESKYNEAKQSFGKVLDDNNKNLYIDQAQWYLALCFMRTDENDKAKQLFGIIIKEDGFYAKDAKKVIKKMK